jgi:superfamily I DNA and RNA helicase
LRQAGQGKKVLFLCFTEALGKWLSETVTHPNITSAAIRVFAAQLLRDKARENPGSVPSEYWNAVSLRAAIDGLLPEEERWDCVIVDEGQDLSESDWMLAEECLRKPGRFWVFADEAQAFWEDRKIPESIQKFTKIKLSKPYRCPRHIQNLVDYYAGRCRPDFELLREGGQENIIRVAKSSEERLTKQLAKEINRLLSEGLKPHEIAVISVRGRGVQENICHMRQIGDHRVFPATDKEADSQIICDTFLRFKGLERPAVIVTDLRLVSDLYEKRMHIATSRALNLLRVIGIEEEIRKDPILAKLL